MADFLGLDPTAPAWLTWYIPIGIVVAVAALLGLVWRAAADYDGDPMDALIMPLGVPLMAAVCGVAWPAVLVWLALHQILTALARWRRNRA